MSYTYPTVSDFKAWFSRDFPYAVPSYGAAGQAVVVNGVITAVTLLSGGKKYSSAPTVTIRGADGVGTGAVVTATVSNEQCGEVTGFVVINGGSGYRTPVEVIITGGSGDETDTQKVTDTDIAKAMLEARQNFNRAIMGDKADTDLCFLYLTAHYLCMDLRGAMQGIWSQYNWGTQSKSVGNVSESYAIPDAVKNNPALMYYTTTSYGAKYLSLIWPRLIGNVFWVPGASLP